MPRCSHTNRGEPSPLGEESRAGSQAKEPSRHYGPGHVLLGDLTSRGKALDEQRRCQSVIPAPNPTMAESVPGCKIAEVFALFGVCLVQNFRRSAAFSSVAWLAGMSSAGKCGCPSTLGRIGCSQGSRAQCGPPGGLGR